MADDPTDGPTERIDGQTEREDGATERVDGKTEHAAGATVAATNWLNLPLEFAASTLAITTVLIALVPLNLPTWGIFIGWAGTFAMGGPTLHNMKRIWFTMPLGACTGIVVALANQQADKIFTTHAYVVIAEIVILFCLNSAMIATGRLSSLFEFVPGMFLGFATFFATYFGGFGPDALTPVPALLVAIAMNALGPIYAWLNVKLMAPHGH